MVLARSARAVIGIGVAASAVAACGSQSGVTQQVAAPIQSTTTTIPEANGDGAAVVRLIGPSIGFVETLYASGTAEVIEGGYLVTNAHVVDPFGTVDLQLPSRPPDEDVPVVGVDLMTDIAVLGPIEDPPPPLPIVDGGDYPVGGAVFLVGYPAARSSDLELTITQGLLSRRQHIEGLDLTMLQTDATIVGGQSGGALVDEDGRFMGVSGIASEGFALALDGAEVRDSARRIIDGDGSEYHPLDLSHTTTTFSASTGQQIDDLRIVMPPPDEDLTVTVTASAEDGAALGVRMTSASGYTASSESTDEYDTSITVVDEGTWTIELWANEQTVVAISTVDGTPADIQAETSAPGVLYLDDEPEPALSLGTPIDAVLEAFESVDHFTVELVAGEPVQVGARTLLDDLALEITSLDGEDSAAVDDGEIEVAGWNGLDPVMSFTPKMSGTYRITLHRAWNDMATVGYRVWVD